MKDTLTKYFQSYYSLWKQDNYLYHIVKYHNNIQLLSIDVFDTLLFRMCFRPIDIFKEVGNRAIKKKYIRYGLNEYEFQQIRILSEKKARRKKELETSSTEVNIREIYDSMPNNIGNKDKLLELELECEKEYCYINPSILSLIYFFKEKNIPIVLVSDMYLSSNQISNILKFNGMDMSIIDLILVSSEYQKNKSSGLLFDVLKEKYQYIDFKNILHIGDNLHSDFRSPLAKGVRAIHYDINSIDFNSVFNYENIRHGEILPEIYSLRKFANVLSSSYNAEDKKWFSFGTTVLGPFLSGYTEWIMNICKEENKNRIYPFMREGKLFSDLISEAAKYRDMKLIVKPIYVSRASTQLASKKCIKQGDIIKFFNRINYTVKDLFNELCLPEGFKEFSNYLDVKLKDTSNIKLKGQKKLKDKLIDFIQREENCIYLEQICSKHNDKLVSYLKQVCDNNFNNIIMLDLGYKGTISRNIESALNIAGIKKNITHLLAFGTEKTSEQLMENVDIRGFAGNAGENNEYISTITRSPEIIEQLIIDKEGSTIGYESNKDGLFIPVLDNNLIFEKEIEKKRITKKGIKVFHRLWQYLYDIKGNKLKDCIYKKKEFCILVHRMIDMPTTDETKVLVNIHHDDNWGSKSISKLSDKYDKKVIEEIGCDKFLRKNKRSNVILSGIYWPQSYVTLFDPTYLLKKYLKFKESNNYLIEMLEIISNIKDDGIKSVVIYGAGEVGRQLIKILKLMKINVEYIIDRNEALWGTLIDSIEILPIQKVIQKKPKTFVIGSFSFIDQIKETIELESFKKDYSPKIYYYKSI